MAISSLLQSEILNGILSIFPLFRPNLGEQNETKNFFLILVHPPNYKHDKRFSLINFLFFSNFHLFSDKCAKLWLMCDSNEN